VSGGPIGHLVGGGNLRIPAGRRQDDDLSIGISTGISIGTSIAPVQHRSAQGSTVMYGHLYQELARQRHREAYLQARRARLARAARAGRRARRAVEIAARAGERTAR
jgi:hypothetical protein